jgi:hypothetical protein
MEYGMISGLAQDFNANERINDLYRQEEALNRSKAMAEQKAKLYADSIKYQNAMNPFDHEIIKKANQQRVMDLGVWAKNNPNYKYDPTLMAEYQARLDDIKSNPDVLRGMASDSAFNELNKDLQEVAKNPEMHDQDAYNQLLSQKDNYIKFGNQKGYEAAQKEGFQPFVYQKPRNFVDLAKTLPEYGSSIQNYDVIKPTGGNIGEYYTAPKAEDMEAMVKSAYQQHGRQIQVEAQKLGMKDPKQVDDWVRNQISAGFKKHYSIGDANAKFENYMRSQDLAQRKAKAAGDLQSNPKYTPFDYLVDQRNNFGTMNPDDIRKVWSDKPTEPLMGNDGTKVDLSGFDINYNGKYIKKQGIPFFIGTVNLPLDVAEQKGIYSEPFGPNLGRTGKIASPFVDKARISEGLDKEGKPMKYVQIDYNLPVNPTDKVARDKFNAMVLPDKLVEEGMSPYMQKQSNVPTASLNEWKSAGWSDEQIKQGINEGKIKVK